MSYWLGEEADLTWDVEVDGVDEAPTTFTVIVTKPDGSTDSITASQPTPGHFVATYQFAEAGHYRWDADADGAVIARNSGVWDVFDPSAPTQPLTGVSGLWSDTAALSRRPEIIAYNAEQESSSLSPLPQSVLNDALRFASEVLFNLTGRQFPGVARTHCRPVARPEGWDARSWGAATPFAYWNSWGSSYSMGYGAASAPALGYHMGNGYPAEVALNYPVLRVDEVKIDGIVIPGPSDALPEYRIDDYRLLVRMRPTSESLPTARGGWPHWQALWLPDTELGTFSVTYHYGAPPPQAGVTAAEVFAVELALDMVGADNRLPARIREISRQGETVALIDSLEALQKGWTGIPICDYFIAATNPSRLARRGSVWSPDMGRNRTPTS